MLPAMTMEGIIAMEVFDGGVGKQEFLGFFREQVVRKHDCPGRTLLTQLQVPLLNPYRPEDPLPPSVVILDNCTIHHDQELRSLVEDLCG
jgi:hypothetical protein